MIDNYRDDNLRLVFAEHEKAIIEEKISSARFNCLAALFLCALCCLYVISQIPEMIPESEYVTSLCENGCVQLDDQVVANQRRRLDDVPMNILVGVIAVAALTFFAFSDSLIKWLKARRLHREHEAFLAAYHRDGETA